MQRCLGGIAWWFAALVTAGCGRSDAPLPTSNSHANVGHPASLLDQFAAARLVDLTHTFDKDTVYWPTGEGFQLRVDAAGVTKRGYYYASNTFTAAEHGGTHLDAPIHFFEGHRTVDQIPLEQLAAKAVIVDVRQQCFDNRDYEISVGDLRSWEEQHGQPLADVIVLLRTGFAAHWPDHEAYLGTAQSGPDAVANLHFPGLAPQAAAWLTEQRSIKAVGIDTASIDFGQSQDFGSHVKLCQHNVPILENVELSDELPEQDFLVIALPMKIGGGSGGPTRIVAVLPAE